MLVSMVVPAAAAVVVVVVIAAMAVMMVVVATMITDAMLLIVLCWSSIEPSFIYYCLSMPSIGQGLGDVFVEGFCRDIESVRGLVQIADNDPAGFQRHA